jgi:hypothetical protein
MKSENHVEAVLFDDPEAKRWIVARNKAGGIGDNCETHHIYGRGTKPEYSYWCNLIRIYKSCHEFGHQVGPKKLELACLHAQWANESAWSVENKPSGDDSQSFWNPRVMARLCGRASLAGRIEVDLLTAVEFGPLEHYAVELLEELHANA